MSTRKSSGGGAAAKLPKSVEIYDTTLRDGSQLEGISLTVEDKLRIAAQLDLMGVAYIEGGWPGSNPKDSEFFERAKTDLKLEIAELTAFGSTRRPNGSYDDCASDLKPLIEAETPVVCIVGKSWDYHVTEALRVPLDEGVAMVADSVKYLKSQDKKVFFDAEHFFDGYKANPDYTMQVLAAAADAGADCLVLCDTNGGSLPSDVEQITREVVQNSSVDIGVHLHNDTDCGVANALAGVRGGALHVQGTINGYGERTGNCNLISVMANLQLKMGVECLPEGHIQKLTGIAHHIAELVNFAPDTRQPYVGVSAFAHKAGLHTSALSKRSDAYEHVDPELVGNRTRFVVSEMSGRSSVELKAKELGIEMDAATVGEVVETLKKLEYAGYHFEVADASLELLMRRATGWEQPYFSLESFEVGVRHNPAGEVPEWNAMSDSMSATAKVALSVGGQRMETTGSGNGPVDALHEALQGSLAQHYPAFDSILLTDYRVRVLDTAKGTEATTRVLVDSTNGNEVWTTIGVSENIIEASWQALEDSIIWGFLHDPSDPVGI